MSSQKWNQAPQAPIDKETIAEMEEEAGVRYKMRERSKWQKKVGCCIFEERISCGRSKPLQRPGFIGIDGARTKKAFLLGAERKLRNAVRREKAGSSTSGGDWSGSSGMTEVSYMARM